MQLSKIEINMNKEVSRSPTYMVTMNLTFSHFPQPINLHIYAKEEHVGFIENAIKTIKERARSMCHTETYRRYTFLITQYMIEGVIDMLNFFPSKNAISNTIDLHVV